MRSRTGPGFNVIRRVMTGAIFASEFLSEIPSGIMKPLRQERARRGQPLGEKKTS